MKKDIGVKFESEAIDGISETYWETLTFELEENVNLVEFCENLVHHDFQVLSMRDIDASVVDVQWP